MPIPQRVDRRTFFKLGAALGGGFVVGINLSACGDTVTAGATQPPVDGFSPSAFLRITRDGSVIITVPTVEMGQGVMTSLSMLVAEELEADWNRVRAEFAPPDPRYASPDGEQVTGGSASVRTFFEPLRQAGATAREMLVAACARQLGVPASDCRAENHAVVHMPTGRRVPFGELVDAAGALPLPELVFLKAPDTFRYIGRPVPHLDTPAKVRGTALFTQDMTLPGMLVAMVERPPRFGARLKSFDAVAAYRVAGVRQVSAIESGIAVIADGFEAARHGRAALNATWKGPSSPVSDEQIAEALAAGLRKAKTVREEGNAPARLRSGKVIEAEYHVPYQAHACMEPMNCIAHVREDGCDIWVGTQAPARAQETAMELTGLPRERVTVTTLYLGGGFGRRAEQDFIAEAVKISQLARAPIKLLWTREDDMRHDFYRPVSRHRLRARVDENGLPVAWDHRIASPSILARLAPGAVKKSPDGTSVQGANRIPYHIPDFHVAYARVDLPPPVGFWRSVGFSQNTFVVESFLDEVAAFAGRDPYEMRRELLRHRPRERRVLEIAAQQAGWGTPPPPGRARGIALTASFGSYVAQVAEVSIAQGVVRVHRVICAVDCGQVVNPDIVKAQMESGIVYGLSATLKGAITFTDGAVRQSSFLDYPILRMDEMPVVDVHIVESNEPPGGIGEPGVPPAAPAVANAVFALTGRPVRRLPIELAEGTAGNA